MAIPHAKPGEVVDLQPSGSELTAATTRTIVKTETLEVIRIVLAAGKRLPPHTVAGEITVQCLDGKVEFRVAGVTRELTAGSFLYLQGGVSMGCMPSRTRQSSLLFCCHIRTRSPNRA